MKLRSADDNKNNWKSNLTSESMKLIDLSVSNIVYSVAKFFCSKKHLLTKYAFKQDEFKKCTFLYLFNKQLDNFYQK